MVKLMNMYVKYLLLGVVASLTACNQPPPTQSSVYQEPVPVHTDIEQDDVALGVATGYALSKQANKPQYSRPSTSYSKPRTVYGKPTVVVNKHYYQSSGNHTKYKSTYRKRK